MNILHHIVDFFGIIVLFGIIAIVLVHRVAIIMIAIDELRRKKSKGKIK